MASAEPKAALIEFWARNVRSYRDEVVLSMEGTRLANKHVVRNVSTAATAPEKVLPVAAIFGANASGKSAILSAMWDMRGLVLHSFQTRLRGARRRVPFLLVPDSRQQPSEYGVEVVLDGVRWRYGLEVDDDRVVSEAAVHYPKGREALVFERENGQTIFGRALRGMQRAIAPLLREDALLLSVLGAVDDSPVTPLFSWFETNLMLTDAGTLDIRAGFTARLARTDSREHVLDLLRAADLGVVDAEVIEADDETVERARLAHRLMFGLPFAEAGDAGEDAVGDDAVIEANLQQVLLRHQARESTFPMDPQYESMGTKTWVGLIAPLLTVLEGGHVLLIDELDGSLHPLLVAQIVRMFQDPETNPRCAQLIFNCHDVNLLELDEPFELGRDQIWLSEKDSSGATSIRSLADYKSRKDESVRRRYLRGRYGGIPRLNPAAFEGGLQRQQDEA